LSLSTTLLAAFRLRPAKTASPVAKTSGIGLALPLKLSFALLIWFFVSEISVETWYRLREPKWQGWSWAVQWPQDGKAFHFIEIPASSLRLLMCDESHAAAWKEPGGNDWTLYWIRWNPGNPAAEQAKVHRPDVCLNAEGAIMENDMGVQLSSVGGRQIPFHGYTFRLDEKTLYVFFCLCEESGPAVVSNPKFEGTDMIQRALQGRRHIGLQSLELALSGYPSEADAREAFESRLGQLMQIRQGAVPGAKE